MCPRLWYLLAAAAVQPLLLHSVTDSAISSLCPSSPHCVHACRGSSECGRPGLEKPMCFSGPAKAGEDKATPAASALHCHPPWGQPTTHTGPPCNQRTRMFCAALTSQWREVWNFWKVLPSQEPLTPMGPPYHNATCLKFTVSCSENPSTLSTVNVKY